MTAAASLTYDSLVTDIQAYADRTDAPFTTQIPRFIMLAENRIAAQVRGLGLRQVVTGEMLADEHTIAKPARWRETISFCYGPTRKFLKLRTYEYCRAYWPDETQVSEPLFYADYDYEHYLVVPTPASNYNFELIYHERPVPLSSDNQTNWTTEYAPQLLLYACLLEAVPFLKNYEVQPVWQQQYDNAAAAIMQEDSANITDRTGRVQA